MKYAKTVVIESSCLSYLAPFQNTDAKGREAQRAEGNIAQHYALKPELQELLATCNPTDESHVEISRVKNCTLAYKTQTSSR